MANPRPHQVLRLSLLLIFFVLAGWRWNDGLRAQGPGPDSPQVLGADDIPDLIVSPESGALPTRALSGANGALLGSGFIFGPGFAGGVRVAVGDVTGDGIADIVGGQGPGGSLVRILNGVNGADLGSGHPYGAGFTGGVFVAVGDLNGDGRNDIIVGQGVGGGGLSVFSGVDYSPLLSLAPFGSGFQGGVTVASGDVNNDGIDDLLAGQASGGGQVALIDGATRTTIVAGPPFGGFAGGIHVAMGDVNGDGRSDLVLATASAGGTVAIYDVATVSQIAALSPYGGGFAAGVRVATADFTGDGMAELVTSPGPGGGSLVSVFLGGSFAPFASLPAYGGHSGGVFVAAPSSSGTRFTSATATTFTVGEPGTFTVRAVGSPPVTSITQTGTLPAGVTFVSHADGTATLSGTPTGPGGTFPLVFTALNGVTPVAQDFTLTVQAAPAITSAAAATFAAGSAGSFTVTTTGFPAATLSSSGALPAGVTFTPHADGTATLAGTPATGAVGTYPLTFTATNGVGAAAQQNFVLSVDGAPVFSSAAAATFTAGAPGLFLVTTAASPPVTTITQTGTLPGGVQLHDNGNGTARLEGTPAPTAGGVYPLQFTASNGVGAPGVQAFLLTVNQAPDITSVAGTTFQTTSTGNFTVTTTGYPVAQVQATGALPSGVTFTNNGNGTATLSGMPGPGTSGVYPLTIAATNGVGAGDTQNFTLTVSSCASTMTPPAGALPAASFNTLYSQAFVASGGTGFTYAVTAGALPAGLTLSSGGALTGTPSTTGAFAFSVTATPTTGCAVTTAYSLAVVPVAANESYVNGVGNTQYSVGAGAPATPAVVVAGTVLSNDSGPGTLTAGPANIATTNGGQVAMAAGGSFLYTPAIGFAGPSDTFVYTLTDGNGVTDTGIVTINLSGVVWYVNGSAAAGNGRSNAPFNTMTAAATAAQAGQTIYVHAGAPAGATALKASQTLWGAGATFVVNGLTIPASTTPTLGATVTLANNVVVRAVNVNAGGGTAITGTNLTGTEVLQDVSITGGSAGLALNNVGGTLSVVGGSIAGVTPGASVALNGGTGTVTIGASITNVIGRSIDIQNRTGGTVTLAGPITDTGAGILLNANTGATISFTGGLSVASETNDAFTATGGGTVVATQNNSTIVNTLTSVSGAALRVVNTQIGAAGLTFRSISAGNPSYSAGVGIVLDGTGIGVQNGGLTVTGIPDTASSGGTIRRKSGADGSIFAGVGIALRDTKNPSFSWMQLEDFNNAAIAGHRVSGFLLSDSVILGAGNAAGVGDGPIVFGRPNPSGVNGLVGTGVIRNSNISEGSEHNVAFYNQSGSMTLVVDNTTASPLGCRIESNSGATGGHGVFVQSEGTASASLSIDRCFMRGHRLSSVVGTALDSSTLAVTVNAVDMSNNGPGQYGVVLTNGGSAALTGTITNNTFYQFINSAIRVGQLSGNATAQSSLRVTITGNRIDSATDASSNSVIAALSSTTGQAAPTRLLFDSNTVQHIGQQPALLISMPDAAASPAVDLTITSNHLDMFESGGAFGDYGVQVAATQGTGATLCANIATNTSHWIPIETGTGGGILFQQAGGTTVSLERGANSLATPAATVLEVNNDVGPPMYPNGSDTTLTGTVAVVENATCQLPSAP